MSGSGRPRTRVSTPIHQRTAALLAAALIATVLVGTPLNAAATEEPAPPTLSNLVPADGAAFATSTLTLSATYLDPNPGDDGSVEFEVRLDGGLVASTSPGSPVAQPGQSVTWQVPPLQRGRTYSWRARAFDGSAYSEWTPANAFTLGGVYPTVDQWAVDETEGRADYSFRVTGGGLNAPGTVAGPCYQIKCSWRVETRYQSGALERNFGTLASGTLAYNTSSLNVPLSGTFPREVTDIRTIVQPATCYGCSQPRDHYDSGWVRVREPYATGDISLGVSNWERDATTGSYTYTFDVRAGGAAQVGGPCWEKTCRWKVEAKYDNDTVGTLASERLSAGTWSFNRSITGTVTGGRVTDVKASLESMCGVSSTYWCWDAWEPYETEWMPVSDFMAAEINVDPLVGFVVGSEITLNELCIRAEEAARRNRVPDTTTGTSTHAVTEACLAASSIPMAIKLMVATAGGAVVVGSIIITLDGNNPNQDAIRKVPSPEADAAGSGVSLPPSCLDYLQKSLLEQELREGGWLQKHHAASDKHSFWTQAYKDLLAQHPWAADKTLGQGWNLMKRLPHRGNHPPAYHYWIYRNLEKALREATDWESFEALWRTWVLEVIENDPTMVRWEWWRC